MLAHITVLKGRLAWSGYGASGDPSHVHALVVDVGRDFLITGDGKLHIHGPGPHQFEEFTPTGVAIAARRGMFGFAVVADGEAAARAWDREQQRRMRLGRRGRIAEDQQRGR